MNLVWWHELIQWWHELPPLFVYLFALPFVIGALGLAACGRRNGPARPDAGTTR
jgi:hypothetical protein